MKRIFKNILYAVLPQRIIFRLLDFREALQGGRKVYYSQFGEDIILENLTKHTEKGFFIDIGANHPIRSSNTFLLYTRGWKGINIEPDPFLFSLLKRYRKRDISIQVGIGAQESVARYYRFADSRISTFSKERAEKLVKKGWKLLEEQLLPVRPLSAVLEGYNLPPIDVMNIDTEDLDKAVLESNDWGKIRPAILVVESRDFNPLRPETDEIYSFLKNKGYELYSRAGYSLIFRDSQVQRA